MWRRILCPHLKALSPCRSSIHTPAAALLVTRPLIPPPASAPPPSRFFSAVSADSAVKKSVEDVMPIATGHEREELEAQLEGKDILEINYPAGPFGTKEAPAVVQAYYDRRIVGCPGGEGEDEHDVVWFWLEKGKPHECPVCTQYFVLDVVGPGGDPEEGHHDHDHDHHH